ncbi:hypothetical protein [Thalassospira lucentensis]|uniref:hypothetical protein n=1 Tax=Thalassospira lucentensis TaxID=168935 RepID=UPI003AA8D3F1
MTPLPKPQTSRCPIMVNTASEANEVFRNRQLRLPNIVPYLEQLQAASSRDLSCLISVARSFLMFQPDAEHQQSRAVIARFFRSASLKQWIPQIDEAISESLDRLQNSDAPDLVRDVTDPLFVSLVQKLLGLCLVDEDAFIKDVTTARGLIEPLLPLRRVLIVQNAFEGIMALVPAPSPSSQEDSPKILPYVLWDDDRALPPQADRTALIATLAVSFQTLAEALALILWGVLQEDRAAWRAMKAPEIVTERLPNLLADYASALVLYRQADQGAVFRGAPLDTGQMVALDMLQVRRDVDLEAGEKSLVFGAGPYRCPGAELSDLVLRRALPALADRFPNLRIELDKAVLETNALIQAARALPCQGINGTERQGVRLWQIRDQEIAREIIKDDLRFSPPTMAEHLEALQRASGKDLSVAVLFARNAMFFMSGARHQAIRHTLTSFLGTNRLSVWEELIDATIDTALSSMEGQKSCDLVSSFCKPLVYNAFQPIFGLYPNDPENFNDLTPELQKFLKPLLPLRDILRLQEVLRTLLDLCRRDIRRDDDGGFLPQSLLDQLMLQSLDDLTPEDALALVLVLYGASFNMSYTLSNALYNILRLPEDQRLQAADPKWVKANMERFIIPASAGPKFIYRLARQSTTVGNHTFAAGDTLQIHLADVNPRGEAGHLAFGHGLHHCVGASLSRLTMSKAITAFFARFPHASLNTLTPVYENNSQTLAPASLSCSLLP